MNKVVINFTMYVVTQTELGELT